LQLKPYGQAANKGRFGGVSTGTFSWRYPIRTTLAAVRLRFDAVLLLFRLGYIASGTIELSPDEAYQWLWSKHLALSYFSKPPGIAFTQFAGTALWATRHSG